MSPEKSAILLVDDDLNDIELARHAFAKMHLDHLLRTVSDGDEALACLRDWEEISSSTGRHPRLLILDLKMPGLDGFGVLKRVRSNPGTRHVPVVILTSSSMRSDIERAYDLGCNAYLTKPVAHEEYLNLIEKLVNFWWRMNHVVYD